MALPRSVIHLLTGERVRADRVEAFLTGSTLNVLCFQSALEAAASLSRKADAIEVVLVLVGADWMPLEDASILDHLRSAWPAAEIVLYGSESLLLKRSADPRTVALRELADLDRWLYGRGLEIVRPGGSPACAKQGPAAAGAAPLPAPAEGEPTKPTGRLPQTRPEGTIGRGLRRDARGGPRKQNARIDRLTPEELGELLGEPPVWHRGKPY